MLNINCFTRSCRKPISIHVDKVTTLASDKEGRIRINGLRSICRTCAQKREFNKQSMRHYVVGELKTNGLET